MNLNQAMYPALAGQVAFISGGASGIGEALVEAFWEQGAQVAFCDIDAERGAALCERLAAAAGASDPVKRVRPWFAKCDVRDIGAYQEVLGSAARELGTIRTLVNNAGRDTRHALDTLTVEFWNEMLEVNLTHHVFATQCVAPGMKSAGGGSIINLGSISWLRGRPNLTGYTASKAAISGITRTLARELGADAIRVNAVLPGWVMTERQIALWRDPAADKQCLELQCLKFRLEPVHVADSVLFLASPQAAAITGQNLVVDAGLAQVSVVG
ncbi:Sulfoquinovose 1-dehydrogenase [Paraburkholderia aspalathi]|uniref:SDR family NAD(P)-dependent oxidoreductase n=1 Tax=Paraburkholderia aspalathi TaxID=1324617 RepID=UPI001B21FE7F|nr:SDR family oxidoreductase [Paraburkholderia aspalathi]MBK3843705.1 SDR family oxidoreductase [Paraburkholderia aspalathi]CAE6858807.1 Sulfoquinovose 1-dehydrogenase [Paraburkholderia aspalathi]CAE6866594.1 Sulfoquinovose 1-dehydrogenase [Paraburkholderia aspalathi]